MISIREMVRGAFGRFLPTATGLLAALLFIPVVSNPHDFSPIAALLLGGEIIGMTLGFLGALAVMRPNLDTSANVAGRRPIVAAVAAVVGLMALSTVVQGIGLARITAAALSVGALSGFAMFWPWLRRRMSERELLAAEKVDVETLAEAQYQTQKLRSQSADAETI